MVPRGINVFVWTLLKGQSDGQHHKIQDHVLPDGGDSHMDIRGSLQLEEHMGGVHLPGVLPTAHTMSVLQADLTAGSMTTHCRLLNGAGMEIHRDQLSFSQTEHLPIVYEVSFPKNMQS